MATNISAYFGYTCLHRQAAWNFSLLLIKRCLIFALSVFVSIEMPLVQAGVAVGQSDTSISATDSTSNKSTTTEVVQVCAAPPTAHSLSGQALADALSWQVDKNSVCGGHYQTIMPPMSPGFEISADHVDLGLAGQSTLQGRVVVNHQDKQLTADTAHITRVDGQVTTIQLLGNITLEEPYHRFKAEKACFNVQTYEGTLEHVLYRLTFDRNEANHRLGQAPLTVWGQACHIARDKTGQLSFTHVTYSSCPPTARTWYLKTKALTLNPLESKGVARDATLYIKNKPFLYIPYISFPLDKQRKSGWLIPELRLTTQNGFALTTPFYLNLAPNYDATLLPQFLGRRGIMFGSEFRYLTQRGQGSFEGHWLEKDRAFSRFREQNAHSAPELLDLSDRRYSLRWRHEGMLDKDLSLSIDYEKVSDDYFLQDFDTNLTQVSDNQLLQQLRVTYRTRHWQFKGLLQRYQTLHPFNQSLVNDIYSRYPSLSAFGQYRQLPYWFYTTVSSQVDKFNWDGHNAAEVPKGLRYHVAPQVGIDYRSSSHFIHPQVTLDMSYYDLLRYNDQHKTITRVLPISSLDTGVFFERQLGQRWLQTLEPRLFYLYTPYVSQRQIPVFDTSYFFPSYNQLFRNNRFVGLDRVGDANQLTLGVTSRIIDEQTGVEQLSLSIGTGYRFWRDRVFLCQDFKGASCVDDPTMLAYTLPGKGVLPLQLETNVRLSERLGLWASTGYEAKAKHFNSALVNFHYEPKVNHIVNAGYGFIEHGDSTELTPRVRTNTNLHQFRLSYAWPLSGQWNSLGAWSYNLSHRFSMSYLLGFQYDDCCVAFRLLGGRVYRYFRQTGAPKYGNNVYVQFLFKGIGSGANKDPMNVIHAFLPTYQDEFKAHF